MTVSGARRVPRWIVVIAMCKLGAALLAVLWLLRDPAPYFERRQGRLIAVDARVAVQDDATSEQTVQLRSSGGLDIELAIRRPAAVEPSPIRRPLFLILGGHERGKGAGALIGDTRGAVFASLEYPFTGNHRAKGIAVVAEVPAIRNALYDTPPAVGLALDYLLSRPDVDPTRVELVGASFGAPFATIAAARDRRVTRLWLAHGGGDTRRMIARGLERDVPMALLRLPLSYLANILASGPRFTPEKWIADVSPRPVVMLNATEDEKIPRESVDLLFASAREPKELVWLPGKHVQGNRPDALRQLVDAVVDRAGLPSAGPR